jgi:hypothetical protein
VAAGAKGKTRITIRVDHTCWLGSSNRSTMPVVASSVAD